MVLLENTDIMRPALREGLGLHQNLFFLICMPFELIKLRLDQCKLIFYVASKLAMKGSVYDGS